MRRGYPTSVYFDAVAALKKECPAVHIVTQLILGLPGESDDDMLESVRRVVAAGSDGIKLTVLYVLAGTDLEKEWRAGNFECLAKEKYFELLKKIVPLLPPDMVAHRLTGDGPKKILLAPDWTKNKRQVLNELAALHLM
jgi:radical SAM superfamily enzyme